MIPLATRLARRNKVPWHKRVLDVLPAGGKNLDSATANILLLPGVYQTDINAYRDSNVLVAFRGEDVIFPLYP